MPHGSVVKHFDERSDGYDSLPSWVRDQESLAAAVAIVSSAGTIVPVKVLDLGAGTGALGKALADGLVPSPTVVSLDTSAGMLALVRTGAAVVGNAHQLPFIDSAFDLVVTRQAFHYFDDPIQVLSEVARTLVEGGLLLVSQIVPFEDETDIRFWTRAMTLRQPLRRYAWTSSELEDVMTKAGFHVESVMETVTRGSLESWLARYAVDDGVAGELRAHFDSWTEADGGLRAFDRRGSDVHYAMRWVTLIGRHG